MLTGAVNGERHRCRRSMRSQPPNVRRRPPGFPGVRGIPLTGAFRATLGSSPGQRATGTTPLLA